MISRLDNFSCHYGNYRRLEAQKKWDVTLRKRREIRGIKPEKRLLNMTTGYECIVHPDFYRQLGTDIPAAINAGVEIVTQIYG